MENSNNTNSLYDDNDYSSNYNNSIEDSPGLQMKKSLSDRHIRTSLDIFDSSITQKKRTSKCSLQNSSDEEESSNSIFPGVDLTKINNESMILNKNIEEESKNSNNTNNDQFVEKRDNFIENFCKEKDNKSSYRRQLTIVKIKEGILQKKSPWFHYNTRKVVLDSSPRIEYIDPSTNRVKVNSSIYFLFIFVLLYREVYI